jgi:hypothetical protein
MTEDDRGAFAELMVGLGETYGEPVSTARMEIYFAALRDLPLVQLRQAATLLVRTSKFFPRPSELREALDGSVDERADLAWVKLLQEVRRVGYLGSPDFGDDVALRRAALELFGGWTRLCGSLPAQGPELLGYAKQFKATYRAYDNRAVRESLPPGETGRELGQAEAVAALSSLRLALKERGL